VKTKVQKNENKKVLSKVTSLVPTSIIKNYEYITRYRHTSIHDFVSYDYYKESRWVSVSKYISTSSFKIPFVFSTIGFLIVSFMYFGSDSPRFMPVVEYVDKFIPYEKTEYVIKEVTKEVQEG